MTPAESIRTIPQRVNPEAIQHMETCFHFLITGEEGGEFTITIKDGQCTERDGLHDSPKCTYRTSAQVFKDILAGKKNPTMAYMTGEVKVDNIGEMMKYAKHFGLI